MPSIFSWTCDPLTLLSVLYPDNYKFLDKISSTLVQSDNENLKFPNKCTLNCLSKIVKMFL